MSYSYASQGKGIVMTVVCRPLISWENDYVVPKLTFAVVVEMFRGRSSQRNLLQEQYLVDVER